MRADAPESQDTVWRRILRCPLPQTHKPTYSHTFVGVTGGQAVVDDTVEIEGNVHLWLYRHSLAVRQNIQQS